jgi:Uma2 family endonuclease
MATPATYRRETQAPETRCAPQADAPPLADDIRASLEQLQQLKLYPGDGDRMESDWHVVSITLLDELVRNHLGAPKHYFCGGNMFIYYSVAQAKEVEEYVEAKTVARKPRFKGPDFFLVRDVDGTKPRESWVVWDEGGRYPDLVVEFISTSTRKKDVDENVKFYARVFRVLEYFWFDRRTGELAGYRLSGVSYTPIEPDARGRLWSEVLGAYLGVWRGEYRGRRFPWLRLWDKEGRLVPTTAERAARERTARSRAEARAEQAEAARHNKERAERERLQAELERLREQLRLKSAE